METLNIPSEDTLECDKIILGGKYEISVKNGNLTIDEKK